MLKGSIFCGFTFAPDLRKAHEKQLIMSELGHQWIIEQFVAAVEIRVILVGSISSVNTCSEEALLLYKTGDQCTK